MRNDFIQITRKERTKLEPFETADTIVLSEDESRLLDSLANVLEYPTEDWFLRFRELKDLSLQKELRGGAHLADFCLKINRFSLKELQELYTRTFDLNPVCALEVGYHLFGEDYKRGEFLARLRESENPYQLGQERQLPDYMPVVLRLLVRMDDSELRASLIGYCLLPALKKMNTAFKKGENPYGMLIRFLTGQLKQIAEDSVAQARRVTGARYQYV